MTRPKPIAMLILALVFAGCGTTSSSDDPTAAATPTPAVGTDEKSVEAVEAHLQDLARRKEAAKRAGDTKAVEELEQAMQKIEREQEAAHEKEFGTATPFDRAVDSLPLNEPPLYVEQFVLDDSNELVVRVRARRFFCGRAPEQRLAAVRAYHALAERAMRSEGIEDFAMIVDGLRETGVVKPLARAEKDVVSLTARGRGTGPC